ncbi:MAG: hypothetical protein JW715_13500 [Sedimentisphaerales bacterium]|nr:hypothetical protein [Sedimentisphaerales bacterium]
MLNQKISHFYTFALVLLIFTAFFLGGCFEEKSEYTINPDLSGKATFDLIFTPSNIESRKQNASLQDLIEPQIEDILRHSKGIESWKDISFEFTDESAVHFIGTAYFPDVNKLSIWRPEFSGGNGLQFSKDPSGRIIIELPNLSEGENEDRKPGAATLSEVELVQQVKLFKLRYNQAKPLMHAMFDNLKSDSLVHLPAKIEKISGFEKVNDTTIRIKWQGGQIIDTMEKMMADDEHLKRFIREGKTPFDGLPDESLYNAIVFGQEGPVQVVLSSDSRDIFDYDAEVADARNNYDQMLKDLGLDLTRKTSPIEIPVASSISVEPGTVKVGGVRLVRYSDIQRNIIPLHQFDKGYTLSLILDLPEPNLILAKGRLEKAITDTGQNILPEGKQETSFPELSKDGNTAVFEVNLSIPDEKAKGIAELSGTLWYLKSAGTKTIDLGLMEFVEGAKSQVEGFSIQSIETHSWSPGRTEMDLKVDLLRGHLISTKFYREDGTEIEVSSGGTSFTENRLLDVGYQVKGKFPPKGRIVLEVIDQITKHEIKFSLKNISLTGEPRE